MEVDEKGTILDGHQRFHAWQGLRAKGINVPQFPVIVRVGMSERDKRSHVRALNLCRRHLTGSQRAQIIAAQLKDTPQQSNRQIANQLRADHKTVATVRRRLEAIGEIPQLERTIGRDGKSRPTQKPCVIAKNKREAEQAIQTLSTVPSTILPAKVTDLKRLARLARCHHAGQRGKITQRDLKLSTIELLVGDFRTRGKEIEDNSVDLIFTDPPYPRDFLHLWDHLSQLAARVLKPGGILAFYCGQKILPDVFGILGKQLEYVWACAVRHAGADRPLWQLRIRNCWKPILVYQKPPVNCSWEWLVDIITGNREKDGHPWQQSELEASHYIKSLCPKGGLVLDPLCGTGTTLAAAAQLGRRGIGIELDKSTAAYARERLRNLARFNGGHKRKDNKS